MHKTIQTEVLYRGAVLERSAKDDRLIACSISSEEPYQRWFGTEILSHDPNHVNLDRVKRGAAPFLADHDTTKMIGKVESVSLSGSRAVAQIMIGNSALAKEILADIRDNLRTSISVGYVVNRMELIASDEENGDTFRVTDWELLHVASVAEPADPTVGIGRAFEKKHTTVITRKGTIMNENIKAVERAARDKETARVGDILAMGRGPANMEKEAEKAVENGISVDAFRMQVQTKLESKVQEQTASADPDNLARQQAQKGNSFADAIASQIPGVSYYEAGRALEQSQEISRQIGKKPRGVFVSMGNIKLNNSLHAYSVLGPP